MDAADAVRDRDDGADVAGLGSRLELVDALLDEIADLGCLDGHGCYLSTYPWWGGASGAGHDVAEPLDPADPKSARNRRVRIVTLEPAP
jgi:hypothetical protein